MTRVRLFLHAVVLALALTGCSGRSSSTDTQTAGAEDTQAYAGIGGGEVVHFTGTEPFWGGQVAGKTLTYSTAENQAGTTITVSRFAGRNGVSFSGFLGGQDFVMAVTPGQCSDGMSDRSYPFTVTLQVAGEQREGCAWTDGQPFTRSGKP